MKSNDPDPTGATTASAAIATSRLMTEADVARLRRELPLPGTAFEHATTWQLQSEGWLSCVLAELNYRIIGRGLVLWHGYDLDELRPYYTGVPVLREIYVVEGWRRHQIGTRVLQHLETAVSARKNLAVGLGVHPDNPEALRLWLRRGYKPHGPRQVAALSTYRLDDGRVTTRHEVFLPLIKRLPVQAATGFRQETIVF